jgi:CRP/FNR family transcriptional regulator, cyclic AMP receptor protein
VSIDPSSDEQRYYELLAHGRTPRRAPAGEVIIQQDEQSEQSMYVVREGTVELRDGERVVETVSAPGLFGELGLIEHRPRSLTAVAATEVTLVEIPARHFWVLVHETPYFAQLVMRVMAHRLRVRGATT